MIDSKKYDEIKVELKKLKIKDPSQYIQVVHLLLNKSISKQEHNGFFSPSSILVSSFDNSEASLVSNFIKFYLNNFDLNTNEMNFSQRAYEIIDHYKIDYDLSFEKFIYLSYAIQFIINQDSKSEYNIINSNFAFYDYQKEVYFTHSAFLKFYIYIVKNPISLFHKYKKLYSGNSHQAFNYLFNLDEKNHLTHLNSSKKQINEFKQSWEINLQSWSDNNTKSTYRGFVLKVEDFLNDKIQFLSEIVAHMIANGINISLDYNKIEEFSENEICKKYQLENEDKNLEISNKEKKFLIKNLKGTYKEFYQID
jgi:hypothetical protein